MCHPNSQLRWLRSTHPWASSASTTLDSSTQVSATGSVISEERGRFLRLGRTKYRFSFIEDGQYVGRLLYMRLLSRPEKIYGVKIGSSYQSQALALSKQFKRR